MSGKVSAPASAGFYDEMPLEQATEYLRDLFFLFPFEDLALDSAGVPQSRSLSVHIAAMVSQFVINLLPDGAARMGFIYNANSQRSGKTLLCKTAVMPLYGSFKAQGWKTNDEELAKVIDAEILAGSTYICYDNVRGYIASPTLEGLMTSPDWTGRILGRTEMFSARNYLTLFITGNDILVSPDMAHRCLICDLFVMEGDVQEREVPRGKLLDEVFLSDPANRHKILSTLWSIVKAWDKAGRPMASDYGFKPRLGFERWGELVGGIVGFAGFGNALALPVLETAGDSQERNLRRLLTILNEERHAPKILERDFGGAKRRDYTFQQIVNVCYEDHIFDYMLEGREVGENMVLKPSSASKFGLLLSKFFPSAGKQKKARKFRLDAVRNGVQVEEVVSVFTEGDGRAKVYVVDLDFSREK